MCTRGGSARPESLMRIFGIPNHWGRLVRARARPTTHPPRCRVRRVTHAGMPAPRRATPSGAGTGGRNGRRDAGSCGRRAGWHSMGAALTPKPGWWAARTTTPPLGSARDESDAAARGHARTPSSKRRNSCAACAGLPTGAACRRRTRSPVWGCREMRIHGSGSTAGCQNAWYRWSPKSKTAQHAEQVK